MQHMIEPPCFCVPRDGKVCMYQQGAQPGGCLRRQLWQASMLSNCWHAGIAVIDKGLDSSLMSASVRGLYMCSVHGSSRLGYLKARSPTAITRLHRTAGSTPLQVHLLI